MYLKLNNLMQFNKSDFRIRLSKYLLIFSIIFSGIGCDSKKTSNEVKSNMEEYNSYISSVHQWREKRVEGLKKNWLSLRGLYWLKEGENTFGSDSANDIIFPEDRAPGFIGKIHLNENIVKVEILEGIEVFHNGNPVKEMTLQSDELGSPTLLEMGSLRWHIIKRDDRYGIRLRDSRSPYIDEFTGIESYDIDTLWRLKARFEPHIQPVTMTIHNVIGTSSQFSSPGALVFQKEGKTYKLNIMSEQDAERYWIIFADGTSGKETYGSGRYLYTDAPDESGSTYIDFNMAYNPPCAFTKYATCPIAPAQNVLPVRITAGEKKYH